MKKTCYVTTPIYYSSGSVHIGNSYSTIASDTFARFYRLKGYDTYFLTGMDEHGQKIEEAAAKANKTPQAFVDEIADATKEIWKLLKITNDDFIRTTSPLHMEAVQEIFERLLAKGDIYLDKYEGDYCVSCETFYTKTQLNEDGTCPDCGKPTRKVQEDAYFLNLKKYANILLEHIKNNPDFIQPETRKNEVVSFIESGLENLCVSRTSFTWGIPVKSNPKHVVYVWIDALSNYISALGYGTKADEKFQNFWMNGDKIVHVVGKDILRFHAIYWPIVLFALDIPVKFNLMAHGWILMREGKMSKSKNNFIYSQDLVARYGLDPVRLFLVKEMPLGNDSSFSYERFVEKYNNDLANDLGNLVSRTVAMVNKYFLGTVTKPEKLSFSFSKELIELSKTVVKEYDKNFSEFRFQLGLNEVWSLISRSNKYIDETTPWALAKEEAKKEELNEVMYHLVESLRMIAIMIAPVMPDTSKKILEELGILESYRTFDSLKFGILPGAKVVEKAEVLFKRLDLKEELEYHAKKEAEKIASFVEIKKDSSQEEIKVTEMITIDDFRKLDLKVGEVISCQKAENADKLLILKVKVGETVRQIVSSIAEYYTPEQMVGKKIVVLMNLKPTKFRGHASEGMLLAASNDSDELELLELTKLAQGASVN